MSEPSENLNERLDVLQDEVDLIKNQIKQNLVDLREFIMSGQAVFPDDREANRVRSRSPLPEHLIGSKTALDTGQHPKTNVYEETGTMESDASLDTATASNIIWWLGTIKRRGLSLRQLGPFLEAYETSGLLSRPMAKLVKLMIRSMEEVNETDESPTGRQGTPEEYADCLLQFNEIACSHARLSGRSVTRNEANPDSVSEASRSSIQSNGNRV